MVSSDGLIDPGNDNAIPFSDIDNAPIYPGCERLAPAATKKCFETSVSNFIQSEFNTEIAKDLNLSGKQEIEMFIRIDSTGEISNLKVRDTNLALQAEAVRVLNEIPQMKPATQNGVNVAVIYSLPVIFDIRE